MPTMFESKCEIRRSPDGYEGVLIRQLTPSSTQLDMFPNRVIPAGRVFAVNPGTGKAELGVDGHQIGFINRRSTGAAMTGFMSDPTAIENAPHVTYKNGANHVVNCYALMNGIEVETTEFDTTLTYAFNDLLRAPNHVKLGSVNANTVAAGGKLTNATVVYGKDPVVGIVVKGKLPNEHKVNTIAFYAVWGPVLEGVTDAVKTAITT